MQFYQGYVRLKVTYKCHQIFHPNVETVHRRRKKTSMEGTDMNTRICEITTTVQTFA